MFVSARKAVLGAALAATALSAASPAFAGDHRRHHKDDVLGAVVLGVLTVAAIAVVTGGDNDRGQRCDGGRDDPDYCYGGRDARGYPAERGQGGYARSGDYDDDRDYRDDRQQGRYQDQGQDDGQYQSDEEQSDEYEQGDDDRGW